MKEMQSNGYINASKYKQHEVFKKKVVKTVKLRKESTESDEKEIPLLFVDVDIGDGKTERVVVY